MSTFSRRLGFGPARVPLYPFQMPQELRNRLWSLMHPVFAYHHSKYWGTSLEQFVTVLWDEVLRESLDTIPRKEPEYIGFLRGIVMDGQWYQAYDLLEHCVTHDIFNIISPEAVNRVLRDEQAAWHFVGKQLVPITDPTEIAAIETALASPLDGVRIHMTQALDSLGDRMNPDPRNAIKEAISALESLTRCITGDEQSTLGVTLEKLKGQGLQEDFANGWKALYKYTNNAGAIRHGKKTGDQLPDMDEAKLFVVTASAFANFLTTTFATEIAKNTSGTK
ncbi:Hypothetical protein I5071_9710 [Sandaracinus amylolyticus]|nr:Hypothetical protein I5071_9710 [Sandaracinus amylolyticus]